MLDRYYFRTYELFLIMVRLESRDKGIFLKRIISGKNPFHPSREHLHHFLLEKHSLLSTLILCMSFSF